MLTQHPHLTRRVHILLSPQALRTASRCGRRLVKRASLLTQALSIRWGVKKGINVICKARDSSCPRALLPTASQPRVNGYNDTFEGHD